MSLQYQPLDYGGSYGGYPGSDINSVGPSLSFSAGPGTFASIEQGFESFVHGLEIFLDFTSIFFMLAIIYIVIQRNLFFTYESEAYKPLERKKEMEEEHKEYVEKKKKFDLAKAGKRDDEPKEKKSDHPRFQKVLEHLESDHPSDWRIAIIEADNIMYDILKQSGFPGESLGEMLSGTTQNSFKTVENAWEAHKKRNMIAHEGIDLTLTKHEAKRIMELYKSVFREFGYL